jgi:hypothetical protein
LGGVVKHGGFQPVDWQKNSCEFLMEKVRKLGGVELVKN